MRLRRGFLLIESDVSYRVAITNPYCSPGPMQVVASKCKYAVSFVGCFDTQLTTPTLYETASAKSLLSDYLH